MDVDSTHLLRLHSVWSCHQLLILKKKDISPSGERASEDQAWKIRHSGLLAVPPFYYVRLPSD